MCTLGGLQFLYPTLFFWLHLKFLFQFFFPPSSLFTVNTALFDFKHSFQLLCVDPQGGKSTDFPSFSPSLSIPLHASQYFGASSADSCCRPLAGIPILQPVINEGCSPKYISLGERSAQSNGTLF